MTKLCAEIATRGWGMSAGISSIGIEPYDDLSIVSWGLADRSTKFTAPHEAGSRPSSRARRITCRPSAPGFNHSSRICLRATSARPTRRDRRTRRGGAVAGGQRLPGQHGPQSVLRSPVVHRRCASGDRTAGIVEHGRESPAALRSQRWRRLIDGRRQYLGRGCRRATWRTTRFRNAAQRALCTGLPTGVLPNLWRSCDIARDGNCLHLAPDRVTVCGRLLAAAMARLPSRPLRAGGTRRASRGRDHGTRWFPACPVDATVPVSTSKTRLSTWSRWRGWPSVPAGAGDRSSEIG